MSARPVREPVPFTDLAAMAREVWPGIDKEYVETLLAARYIGGEPVERFERDWAAYCETTHAVGVANGTDALLLTLEALGIGRGDEVVVPANTFVATVEAVVRAGATPRFADVDEGTLLLTGATLEEAITPRTKAVIAVHLYGQVVDLEEIGAVAERHGLLLVEDAAQAHGARRDGHVAGSYGVAGCFSFYPGKNLGAFGDAGAVVTSDAALADRIRSVANHGRPGGQSHYQHELLGTNSRLDTLQAIVLSAKLARNEAWSEARIARAADYRRLLADGPARLLEVGHKSRHVYHLLVARVPERDRVRDHLTAAGVGTGVHYPVPCHQLPPLLQYADRPLPVVERSAGELLSLPMHPHLTTEQVVRVCSALEEAMAYAAVAEPVAP